ncbi:hypothetical protein F5878DRAFT_579750 [Lentinula raphanica]|uniref:Uncharacterized protein n=1 Tax=Lentinula raphanica TaxID=153919 RepID=A0AA38UGJ9_9AGAR|nr:hypothetical protein F5878DRAFT_579750 [Lentinula raphanica]
MYIPRISDFFPVDLASPGKVDARSGFVKLALDDSTHIIATGDSCNDIHHCRTLLQILWSCISVLVACTWVAVHPNIPGSDESSWEISLRRLKLMLLTLIAPEIVVLWAVRQWYAASKLSERFDRWGWSQTHSFFALMGGFQELTNTLHAEGIESLLWESGPPTMQILMIGSQFTEVEIQDRSHRDALAKSLAIGQTAWFVIQLVARRVEGLSIAALEIMTVAFAAMNVLIYTFWWNKPQGVRFPIHLEPPAPVLVPEPVTEVRRDFGDWFHGYFKSLQRFPKIMFRFLISSAVNGVHCVLDSLRKLLKFIKELIRHGLILRFVRTMIISCLTYPAVYCYLTFKWVVIYEAEPGNVDSTGLKAEPKIDKPQWHQDKIVAYGAAVVFGAIHCAAWDFVFPTKVERTLWRICASIATFVPLLLICYDFMVNRLKKKSVILGLVMGYAILFYVLARSVLVGQAFVALRKLPSTSFETVEWVTFLPHI